MPSIAPHAAAWERRWPGVGARSLPSSGAPTITFPSVRLGIVVELFLGGEWVDVSQHVYAEPGIRIRRGRFSEQEKGSPSKATLTFKNNLRYFSPRNPHGPYFGQLVRSVKLRISVNPGPGNYRRFTGRVSEWPPEWTSGDDRYVSIEANGRLRRSTQGEEPVKSVWRRYIESRAVQPIAYWPCEDEAGALFAVSAFPGAPGLAAAGGGIDSAGVKFAEGVTRTQPDYTGYEVLPVATLPLASLGDGGSLRGPVPLSSGSPVAWTVQFAGRLWAYTGVAGADIVLARWATPGGSFERFEVQQRSLDGGFQLVGVTTADVETVLISPAASSVDLVHFRITAIQNGANVDMSLRITRILSNLETGTLDTDSRAGTLKHCTEFQGNPNGSILAHEPIGGSENQTNDIVLGHVQFHDTTTSVSALVGLAVGPLGTLISPWSGYLGERPTDRFVRLYTEEGVSASALELIVDNVSMGMQPNNTLTALIDECEAANEGLTDEDFDGNPRLISRTARYNQEPGLRVDYAAGQLQPEFETTDDDRYLRNDWSVRTADGKTAHHIRTSGPLNINEPEDDSEGAGRYEDETSPALSLDSYAQAHQHAAYRVAKGTIDEPRWPAIAINLAKSSSLIEQWLSMDNGSRLLILDAPDDVGGGDADQCMDGYEEWFNQVNWTVSIFGVPNTINEVGRLDDARFRLVCGAATVDSAIDDNDTTLTVAIDDACGFGHDDGDYDLIIAGEQMTVTAVGAVAGSLPGGTQDLTVTRAVNGVAKSHVAGESVRFVNPFRLAL